MPSVALQHRDEIITRLAKGDYLSDIAVDLGLSPHATAISNALSSDPEYQRAREWSLDSRMVRRESELESADPASVPRARELLSHARWRAEREAPHRWGQKQQLDLGVQVQVILAPHGVHRTIDANSSDYVKSEDK